MAAANTDYFTEVGSPGSATTLAAPGHTIGGTTFNVGSTANMPTTTGVIFAVDSFTMQTVNGVPTAVRTPGTYTEWEGVVTNGTTISSAVLRYGTDQNYSAGSTTRVYIPVSSSRENRLAQGIQVQHNQDGSHGAVVATSINTTSPNGINQAALPLGTVVQIVEVPYSAVATGTTTFGVNDNVPQQTDGTEFMSASITPKSTTNKLSIEASVFVSNSAATQNMVAALYQDATAASLAATQEFADTATAVLTLNLKHTMTAGTTSSTTFKVRAGAGAAGTTTFNGSGGTRRFGATVKSVIRIIEYKA